MKDRVLRISILTLLAVFFIVAKPQAQEQATNPIIVKTEVVFSDGTAKLGELTLDQFPKLHDCVVQQSLDCTLLDDVESEAVQFSDDDETLVFIRTANGEGDETHAVQRIRVSLGQLDELNEKLLAGMHHSDHFVKTTKAWASRPILGVYVDGDDSNLRITGVVSGKGAEAAGLQSGDVLLTINEIPLKSQDDISQLLKDKAPGDWVQVTYERNGAIQTANIQLSESSSYKFSFERDPCKVFIGVSLSGLGADDRGVRVSKVIDGTAAAAAGVADGDVILAMDGVPVNSFSELLTERNSHQPGEEFVLTVQRGEQVLDIEAQFKNCDEKEETTEEAEQDSPIEIPAAPSIDNSLELVEFSAYPNPTVGKLNIRFSAEAAPIEVSISDVSGRVLFNDVVDDFDGHYNKEINVSKGTPGALSLKIMQNGQLFTKQIILLNRA
ncbi:MAG: hypothetical protein Kow0027_29540 [Saprospiraceae bacterium]|nr:hypothetical protein [Saprospirales bacterium]